jgi:fructose-bisphosphate aldolase, class II
MMKPLRQVIDEFKKAKKAVGHFNVSDSNQLEALAEASKETGLPVIAGLSEGEREFFPLSHVRVLVDAYQKEGVQIYLNADHTYSIEKVKEAIDAGVDSVVVDGAKLPFEDNVVFAQASVAYARASGRDVIIEGELGYIGTSSKVMDALPEGAQVTEELMTKVDEAGDFVQKTGVDMLAPAVGNVHGMIKGGDPKLSITRIGEIAKAAGVPLVLHGGSGNTEEEFSQAIKAGIAIIHINTELRVAYHDALKETLDTTEETTPYKFLSPAVADMRSYIVEKIKLFAA